MSEQEWRRLGVQMSQGWVHFLLHAPGKLNIYHFVLLVKIVQAVSGTNRCGSFEGLHEKKTVPGWDTGGLRFKNTFPSANTFKILVVFANVIFTWIFVVSWFVFRTTYTHIQEKGSPVRTDVTYMRKWTQWERCLSITLKPAKMNVIFLWKILSIYKWLPHLCTYSKTWLYFFHFCIFWLHILMHVFLSCFHLLLCTLSSGFSRPNTTLRSVVTGLKKPLLAG